MLILKTAYEFDFPDQPGKYWPVALNGWSLEVKQRDLDVLHSCHQAAVVVWIRANQGGIVLLTFDLESHPALPFELNALQKLKWRPFEKKMPFTLDADGSILEAPI